MEIWLPHSGPTVLTVMLSALTPSRDPMSCSSLTVCGPVSDLVWTSQLVLLPDLTCCTMAPLTPPACTASCTWLMDADGAEKVKTAPPLKSTL